VRFAFIHAEKASFTISALCRVLDVSRQGYYAYAGRPPPTAVFDYVEILYNRRRLHSSINYKTPAEVEAAYFAKAA
jgi:transposase InsO family protein